jgi:hypothetical protein
VSVGKKKRKKEKERERDIGSGMASSSSGYVVVSRCPLTFDGSNYVDFAAHMRVYMRGLRLWGFLCGEVSCSPCPTAPVAPVPPTPPVIAADASEADRIAAKTADDAAVDAYDQQVVDFSESLSTYRDAQWCDEDARVIRLKRIYNF